MKKRMLKIAACLIFATITFGGAKVSGMASGLNVPLAGLQAKVQEQKVQAEKQEVKQQAAPSKYDGVAIAQVNEDAYVNIRDAASTEKGNVLGKLYNNSAAEILGQDGDWYLIKSGSVTGYVSKEFFATGEKAEKIAKEVGNEVATVNTTTLMVRQEANTSSDVVTLVGDSQKLEVQEDMGDWVKVAVDDDVVGYVAKQYVECKTQFVEAESKEEEKARLKAEEEAYLAALEEARKADEAANKAWQEYLDSQEQSEADKAAQEAADAISTAEALKAQQQAAEQEAADAQKRAEEQADAQAKAEAEQAQAQAEAAAQAAAQAQAEAEAQRKAAEEAQKAADEAAQQQQQQQGGSQSSDENSSSGSSQDTGLRQSVVSFALQFVGNPYVWGGTSLTNGADCSGFTQSVMANFGISIPRVAEAQAGSGRAVDLGSIQPGDLLFYGGSGGIGHVSMYIGNNQVVHASTSTTGIIVSDMGYRQPISARSYLD